LFFCHNINVKENVFSEHEEEGDTLRRAALSTLTNNSKFAKIIATLVALGAKNKMSNDRADGNC